MEDVKEEGKIERRNTPEFWRNWLKAAAAGKAAQHKLISKEAWTEFEDGENEEGASYPIYWSSSQVVSAAYYSRTPQLTNKRRFEIDDPKAATACLINKRLGDYLVESSEFDAAMMAAVGDFIHTDKATIQIVHEGDCEEVPLYLDEEGNYIQEDGTPFNGEVITKDDALFGKLIIPETQRIYLSPACYDEVLHTPSAKNEAEIKEKTFFFCMTKDEALERFKGIDEHAITWKKTRTGEEKHTRSRELQTGEEYLEGWEIYSKPNKRVYWISEQYKEGFLDKKDDPYQFRDFFPCTPFIIGSKPSKHLYPTPVYKRLKSVINTLTKQADKIYELMDAIDPRALIDGTNNDLLQLLDRTDCGKYVAVQNLMQLIEKGGIQNLVQFLPTAELVSSVTTFMQAEASFKETFFEVMGVPDVLRGQVDPAESATATNLEAGAAQDRFKFQKKQVRQMARDAIEMMLDLAYKVFSDEKIAQIVGFDYMQPDDQANFPEALAILRDDETRLIRIEIETDSLSFVDEQLRSQNISQVVQTVTAGLEAVAKTAKTDPQLARVSLRALLSSLEALGPQGMQYQDDVKKALEQIIEAAENPPQTPPPPDYEMLKIQNEQMKLQQDGQNKATEFALEERKIALEERKEVVNEQLEQIKTTFQQQLDSALLQIENQRVSIEQFKAQVQASESQMEEIRLARESDLKAYSEAVQAAQTQAPAEPQAPMIIQVPSPQMPAINLNVEAGKPARKRATVVENPMTGQMEIISEEIPEEPVIGVL